MIEQRLHTYSMIGTVLCCLALGGGTWAASEAAGDDEEEKDPFANMVVIDAALAEKGAAEPKQPVKEVRAPPPPETPTGVSRDENAAPVIAPEKPKPDRPDVESVLERNRAKDEDEDLPVGKKPPIEIGRIDGVEVGFGDKTHGNPYLGALKSGFMRGWEYPEILSDVGIPVGCIQLEEDGTIDEVKLLQASGNPELDDSVERALADFKIKNNKEPKPLPTTPEDLTFLERMPLCWRLKV